MSGIRALFQLQRKVMESTFRTPGHCSRASSEWKVNCQTKVRPHLVKQLRSIDSRVHTTSIVPCYKKSCREWSTKQQRCASLYVISFKRPEQINPCPTCCYQSKSLHICSRVNNRDSRAIPVASRGKSSHINDGRLLFCGCLPIREGSSVVDWGSWPAFTVS